MRMPWAMMRQSNSWVWGLLILVGGWAIIAIVTLWIAQLPNVRATQIIGTYCPSGSKSYLLKKPWKNIGNRPIRTLYVTIRVYAKDGREVDTAVDYPIYSVPDSEPGVAPGETHQPGSAEGYIIPIGYSSPDAPNVVDVTSTSATESGIE